VDAGGPEPRPDDSEPRPAEPEDGSADETDESSMDETGPASVVEPSGPACELCGHSMLDRHCKLVCLHCGYMRDCSDP